MPDFRNPVEQTPFSQQGKSLQTITFTARKGLATAIADSSRGVDYAKVLNNVQMIARRGIWTSRGIGFTHLNAAAFNAAAKFMDFAIYYDALGAQTLLAQVGDRVGTISADFQTFTALPAPLNTGLSTTLYPCMRMFSPSSSTTQPMLIYCNGAIEPQKITGAVGAAPNAAATLTGWPIVFNTRTYTKPALCEPFGSRMVYSKFGNGGASGNLITQDVLISDLNNAETYTTSTPAKATDAVAFTIPAVLGTPLGMRRFKLSNQTNDEIIVGGCSNGMWMITGTDAPSYRMLILTQEHGLLNNRSWAQARNDLIYASTSGFRSYNALSANANLVNDQLSILIKDLVQGIDQTLITGALAFHNPDTQEIQFWAPQTFDSGLNSHAFILNYNNDESGTQAVSPIWSTKSGCEVQAAILFKGVLIGGRNGFLQKHYTGDTYNGTAISFNIVTALAGLGNFAQTHRPHKIIVVTEGGQQAFSMNGYMYEQIEDGGIQRVLMEPSQYPLFAGVLNATVLGTWILGTSAFPSNHIKTLDYYPAGHGLLSEYEILSASSQDAIDFAAMEAILSGGGLQR